MILRRADELGNHTFSHPNLTRVARADLLEELDKTRRIMEKAGSRGPLLFRPPGGDFNGGVFRSDYHFWKHDLRTLQARVMHGVGRHGHDGGVRPVADHAENDDVGSFDDAESKLAGRAGDGSMSGGRDEHVGGGERIS